MLKYLQDNQNSFEFRLPVDWKGKPLTPRVARQSVICVALGLVDYPIIIKIPMDLSTVQTKLDTKEYKHIEEVLNDL